MSTVCTHEVYMSEEWPRRLVNEALQFCEAVRIGRFGEIPEGVGQILHAEGVEETGADPLLQQVEKIGFRGQ